MKKGFTIVELVIVIAVIAILAAVMIPTFTGIVDKAQKSAALQEARTMMTEYIALKNGSPESTYYIKIVNTSGTYYFLVNNGQIDKEPAVSVASGATVVIKDTDGDNFPNTEIYNPAP